MRKFSQKFNVARNKALAVAIIFGLISANLLGVNPVQTSPLLYLPIFSQFLGATDLISAQISQAAGEELLLPASGERAPDKKANAVITAYTSTVDQCDEDPFIAAGGKRVYDGMIAANWLPLGTKVKIPSLYGDKIFTVDDRMNARYGYGRMDIWLDTSKAEAKKFGVKRVEVEVYYNR